jgi:hypothetical protein
MAGSITEKGILATGITAIFGTAAVLGYIQSPPAVHDIPTALTMAALETTLISGAGLSAWAGGYIAGKVSNTVFGTQKMDDILSRIAGYGMGIFMAFTLAADMPRAAEPAVQPENDENKATIEITLPPPFAFERDEEGLPVPNVDYSLIGPDTVQRLQVNEGRPADIIVYNFAAENARYFQLHNHGRDIDMVPIAIKPFRDVDQQTLAHAQVMGCVAALQKRDPEFNKPFEGRILHYLKTYCPHP